jgi:hypothetical protein
MSYVLTPYLIDLERLQQAVGSQDESLIAALLQAEASEFEDEWEEGEPGEQTDSEISLEHAVRCLVMGEQLGKAVGSQYGYALERLCRYLGEAILPETWGGVRWAAVEDSGLEDLLMQTGPPVPIPDPGGFPTIGHWTAVEVAAKVNQLGTSHLTSDDDGLQELLAEYENWLRTAAAKRKAIVFFYA